ncbi:hypothetical protein A2U01_0098809, partial [Trifolium medium]|nr:hypothetical protein [Trifolium medium]
ISLVSPVVIDAELDREDHGLRGAETTCCEN